MNPEHTIVPISLFVGDAHNTDNKNRRNTLYRRFGIEFVYREVSGIANAEGVSDPKLTVHDLIEHKSWDNIRTCCWLEGFHDLARAHHHVRAAARQSRREAMLYRKKAPKFEERVQTVARRLSYLINWPLAIITAIMGFAVGRSDLAGLWTWLTLR